MKFSVVIPCYNYAHGVAGTLDAALAQDPRPEVLVVDDGSTDDLSGALAPYLADGRVRLHGQENRGVAAARNAGAALARGQYLLFCDADDHLLPDAFARFAAALAEHPAADFLLGGHYSVSGDSRELSAGSLRPLGSREESFRALLRKELGLATGAALIHRRVFQTLRFPETLRLNEDLVFFAHMLARHDGHSLGQPVLEVFRRPDSLRHDVGALPPVEATVDALFDPELLPEPLFGMRGEFLAGRWLSRFRTLYLAGRTREARAAFRAGVRARPTSLLRFSYLTKYVRSFFR